MSLSFRVAVNAGLSHVCAYILTLTLKNYLTFAIFINYFKFSSTANMDIKFYTKTKLYAKHGHTFYNVTSCKGENSQKSM